MSFVRAIIGLPFVPLDRLREGRQNLDVLANKLQDKKKQFRFAKKTLTYVDSNWIEGIYPPESWNMFDHDGITTNNFQESYNSKLGAAIKAHPNPYLLASVIRDQLQNAVNDATMARLGVRPGQESIPENGEIPDPVLQSTTNNANF
jgi:transposase-like protein